MLGGHRKRSISIEGKMELSVAFAVAGSLALGLGLRGVFRKLDPSIGSGDNPYWHWDDEDIMVDGSNPLAQKDWFQIVDMISDRGLSGFSAMTTTGEDSAKVLEWADSCGLDFLTLTLFSGVRDF